MILTLNAAGGKHHAYFEFEFWGIYLAFYKVNNIGEFERHARIWQCHPWEIEPNIPSDHLGFRA